MTPDEEERVRELLASTPAEEPIPGDVAARLDDTLARLVAGRDPSGTAPVGAKPADELEERRRRRWPRLLVAAASVALLGYGVGALVNGVTLAGGDASSGVAMSQADSADRAGGRAGSPEVAPEPERAQADAPTYSLMRDLTRGRPVLLHRDSLRQDVEQLLRMENTLDERRDAQAYLNRQNDVAGRHPRCVLPAAGTHDELSAVRLDGRRATLVVRKAIEGMRVAEVYSCGDASKLLAITRVDVLRPQR